jgi:hypothetical protein
MNRRTANLAAAVIALTFATPAAVAFDQVSSAGLAERCRAYLQDADSPDGRFCAGYVRGFIDGSPEVALMASPEGAARPRESFAQRAARTRLGRSPRARPEYCIDASLGMMQLVEQVVAMADEQSPRDEVDASVLLHATLARFHSCE